MVATCQKRSPSRQSLIVFPPTQAGAKAKLGRTGRKRGSYNIDAKAKASEAHLERWKAKKPRLDPTSWLSGLCSACEKPNTGAPPPLPPTSPRLWYESVQALR